MPKATELITAFIGRTLNMSTEEVATLIFETVDEVETIKADALNVLLEKDRTRVQKFTDERKTQFDNGYNKAKVEVLSKFEREIKDKFKIDEDKQGLELIDSVVTTQVKSQGGELDEEKIKRSTPYLSMFDRLTKEKAEAVLAETTKLKDLQDSIQKESNFKSISDQANEVIRTLNPILPVGTTPEGKSKADAQIARFIKELGSEYSFETKDNITLVIKDGKVLEDAHGNRINFADVVKQRASELWDFKEGTSRQGTGNNNDTSAAASANTDKGYKGPVPKTESDYMKFISEAKDDQTKQDITKAWNTEQLTK